jgi:hypothetical protein
MGDVRYKTKSTGCRGANQPKEQGVTKKSETGVSATARLIERQAKLWSHAEAIELAQTRGEALPADVSEWLHRALKNIACGKDANLIFDVVPEKKGVRKDGFLLEMQRKMANGYIAAATEKTSAEKKKTTARALDEISAATPKIKRATAKKTGTRHLLIVAPHSPLEKNRYSRSVSLS